MIVLSFTLRFNYFQFSALPLDIPIAFPTTSDASPEYLLSPRILIVHILVSFSHHQRNFSSKVSISESNVPTISTLKDLLNFQIYHETFPRLCFTVKIFFKFKLRFVIAKVSYIHIG